MAADTFNASNKPFRSKNVFAEVSLTLFVVPNCTYDLREGYEPVTSGIPHYIFMLWGSQESPKSEVWLGLGCFEIEEKIHAAMQRIPYQ